MRQLRFNYAFPTGYVQIFPLQGPNTLIYPALAGIAATQAPTAAEFALLAVTPLSITPYTITIVASSQYLIVGVPAQFGIITTFTLNGTPTVFFKIPSNDQDSLADTGTNVGEPFFLYINGIQYAYNFYASPSPATGTNTIIVPYIGP